MQEKSFYLPPHFIRDLPGLFYCKDLNLRYINMNDRYIQLLGKRDSVDIQGYTNSDLHCWDVSLCLQFQHDEQLVMQNKAVVTKDYKIPGIYGATMLHIRFELKPIFDNNQVVGVQAFGIDMTDVKVNEEAVLRDKQFVEDILYNLPGFIYWKNKNSQYVGFNKLVVELSRLSREQLQGKTDKELNWGQSQADQFVQDDQYVMRTGKSLTTEYEVPIRREDGKTVHVRTDKMPLYNVEGEIAGILAVAVDITNQKELETQLKSAREQADNFNKIALQVSHDICSPLATISMLAEISKTMPEDERVNLRQAVQRIHDIADGLLSYYREKKRLCDEDLIKRTLISTSILSILSEKRMQSKNSQVTFNFVCDSIDYFACIDTNLINFKRMMSNILNNSIEALKNLSGTITISLKKNDNFFLILVSDTGIGMTIEQVQHLTNHQPVVTNKSQGHGLGLAHAKETLKKSNAEFMIESQINYGTTITLKFPAQDIARYLISEVKIKSNTTIVILDDDPSIHDAWNYYFNNILAKYPEIKLQHFADGQLCVNHINTIDKNNVLLLTDYELIDQPLNGLDVVAQAKVNQAILVTSHYEDLQVIADVLSKNVKILPKILAPHLKLEVI